MHLKLSSSSSSSPTTASPARKLKVERTDASLSMRALSAIDVGIFLFGVLTPKNHCAVIAAFPFVKTTDATGLDHKSDATRSRVQTA